MNNKLEIMAKMLYSDSKYDKEDRKKVIKILMNALLSDHEEYERYEKRYDIKEEIKNLPFYTVYDVIEKKIIKTFSSCCIKMCNLLESNKNYKYLNRTLSKDREIYYSLLDSQNLKD